MTISESKFLWGAASASHQVEGGWDADGKGLSKWDVYTHRYRVTKAVVGKDQTADVAINQYSRAQYLKDIAFMREVGLNAYRFSLSWPRILPDGTGAVNDKGLDYYSRLVDDLIAAGVKPVVTLYHWDYPWTLSEKGGWHNRDSIAWFREYAGVVFGALGDRVELFVTMNEPFIDLFLMDVVAENVRDRRPDPWLATSVQYARQAPALHHLFLAHARTVADYRTSSGKGMIGMAVPLMPTIPIDPAKPEDVAAARLADGVINRWPLEALFQGSYPDDVVEALRTYNPDFLVTPADLDVLADNPPDFLGVNFYAPVYVDHAADRALGFRWFGTNPDRVRAFNGPVRPEAFYDLLMHIRANYGDPPIFITENGTGYGDFDEVMEDGIVKDPLRTDYIRRHIDAMLRARRAGADVRGYMLWSLFDNFEWIQGFERRFGLVHVDFSTQKRTPKQSFYAYRDIIAKNR
ncbi:MAG: family 1 glycosylhydrolase [Bauldia sp.]